MYKTLEKTIHTYILSWKLKCTCK